MWPRNAQMAQYCHKWLNKEEPLGKEERAHETLEPITGLEDEHQAYTDPESGQLPGQPQGARKASVGRTEAMEPMTGLEDTNDGIYASQSQPPGDHRQSEVRQQTAANGAHPELPGQPGSQRLPGVEQHHHGSGAAGEGARYEQLDALGTSPTDIMDSHAAMFSSRHEGSSAMHKDLPGTPAAQLAGSNAGANGSLLDHSSQQRQLQQRQLQQQQLRQPREAAKKADDPGVADGFGQRQADSSRTRRPTPKDKSTPSPWVLFYDSLAAAAAVAITALFIVLLIIDTGARHEGAHSLVL